MVVKEDVEERSLEEGGVNNIKENDLIFIVFVVAEMDMMHQHGETLRRISKTNKIRKKKKKHQL